jgi:hypothetical protein
MNMFIVSGDKRTMAVKGVLLAFLILAVLSGCQNPFAKSSKSSSRSSLTVKWVVGAKNARTILPSSYPTPTTYDVTLHPASGSDVVRTGLTGTSWTFQNLAATTFTITVTGNYAGNPIVQGTGTADLTSSTAQYPAISLYYITTGTGTGSINLVLDWTNAGATVLSEVIEMVDPSGTPTTPSLNIGDTTAAYTNSSAEVGTYKLIFTLRTGTTTATKTEYLVVFQNIATTATVSFTSADFSSILGSAKSLALNTDSLLLVGGQAYTMTPIFKIGSETTATSITWSSSNSGIASVDANGLVTAGSAGTATITAASSESGLQATCAVSVDGATGLWNDSWTAVVTANTRHVASPSCIATPDSASKILTLSYASSAPYDTYYEGYEIWTYSATAAATGTIYFTWIYTGNHGGYSTSVGLWDFSGSEANSTQLMNYGDFNIPFTYSSNGIVSLDVTAGLPYGFIARGSNIDPSGLTGKVVITGSTFVPRDGLIGEFLFNGNGDDTSPQCTNSSETVTAALTSDRLGNANHAYATTSTTSIVVSSPALQFNYTQPFSMSAWFNTADIPQGANWTQLIGMHGNAGEFQYYFNLSNGSGSSGTLSAGLGQCGLGDSNAEQTITTGTWYHAVMAFNGSTIDFYLNGTHAGTSSAFTYFSATTPTTPFIFGGSTNSVIDDCRIYNRCLTAAEVSQLYHENGYGY